MPMFSAMSASLQTALNKEMKMTWLIDADGDIQNSIGDKIADMHITTSANRAIIAAAPELLAALSDLMKSCQNWAPTIDRSRARAAIDKATNGR
jgi:hypothetical protein